MPSMFRRPGEDSSSDESSSDPTEEENTGNASTEELNLLSRINTIDSQTGPQAILPSRPPMSRNNSQFRDLILHSLLEDKALREAAEHLGKDQSDPEVQELARSTYRVLSQQLSGGTDTVDERYASDEMRQHRAKAQEGIEAITRGHITQVPSSTGQSRALMSRNSSTLNAPLAVHALPNLNVLLSQPLSMLELPLQGYPGLHKDRYVREFVELEAIGKGGYGKVYKVKHKLDDSFYAVKRIMISPARVQKIQDNGPKEMESLLEEVRALARFDHGNIVRYHNCWLEFTTASTDVPVPTTTYLRNDRLIEDGNTQSLRNSGLDDLRNLSLGEAFDPFDRSIQDSGGDILFEYSDAGPGAEAEEAVVDAVSETGQLETPKQRKRSTSQVSQATIATISSSRSHLSAVASVGEEEDEDVETIPRSHHPFSFTEETGTESMVSHSDMSGQLVPLRTNGPILTLNVQMSLYDTNLAAFLSTDRSGTQTRASLQHCFHPCISLQLLDNIISGVEYLHAQGVVHRDLKPANIFLAVSTAKIPPSGSVNLATCNPCSDRSVVYLTPRIGDFGLVAALGEGCMDESDDGSTREVIMKPVGTEFYRPTKSSRISEKLDIFALGVVAFEMLNSFTTRMERYDTLNRLRQCLFPDGFADRLGTSGLDIQELIAGMVLADEEKRWSCEDVRAHIQRITAALKTWSDSPVH